VLYRGGHSYDMSGEQVSLKFHIQVSRQTSILHVRER
jgi:hypothetical protein